MQIEIKREKIKRRLEQKNKKNKEKRK